MFSVKYRKITLDERLQIDLVLYLLYITFGKKTYKPSDLIRFTESKSAIFYIWQELRTFFPLTCVLSCTMLDMKIAILVLYLCFIQNIYTKYEF